MLYNSYRTLKTQAIVKVCFARHFHVFTTDVGQVNFITATGSYPIKAHYIHDTHTQDGFEWAKRLVLMGVDSSDISAFYSRFHLLATRFQRNFESKPFMSCT